MLGNMTTTTQLKLWLAALALFLFGVWAGHASMPAQTILVQWDNPDATVNPMAMFYQSGLEVTRDLETWALVGTWPYQESYSVRVLADGPMFFRAFNAIR